MATAKGVEITNLDATPRTTLEAASGGGKLRVFMDTIAAGTGDLDNDDIIVLAQVPSNAKLASIRIYNDDFGDGSARYEEATEDHHDHLINIRNGKVVEFQNEEIEALQKNIAEKHGLKLVGHRLERRRALTDFIKFSLLEDPFLSNVAIARNFGGTGFNE